MPTPPKHKRALKWRRTAPEYWARGPLRVYSHDGWYFPALLRRRAVEDVDDKCYRTAEAAMKAADKWASEIARLLALASHVAE